MAVEALSIIPAIDRNPPYTFAKVALMLKAPLPWDVNLLTEAEESYFNNQMSSLKRWRVSLPQDTVVDFQPWYLQGNLDCLPSSLMSVALRQDIQLPIPFMRNLLISTLPQQDWQGGATYPFTRTLMDCYPDVPATLDQVPLQRTQQPQTAKKIERNAAIIKDSLDNEVPLLTAVRARDFIGLGGDDLHAIALVGYEIWRGFMNVQILDSISGSLWTSLEHLTGSLDPHSTFRLRKTNPLKHPVTGLHRGSQYQS